MSIDELKPTFLIEFSDHSSVVNIVRFSPSGCLLATASDRQIIVYAGWQYAISSLFSLDQTLFLVRLSSKWDSITDAKEVEKIWLRSSLEEIYDLSWSPDNDFIMAGAINCKVSIDFGHEFQN